MKKILYLSSSIIPSIYANSVHTIKMCEYFSKNQNDVLLIARSGKKSIKEIYATYNIKYPFKLIQLNNFFIGKIGYLINFFFIIMKIRNKKYDIIYGRNIFFIFFSLFLKCEIFLELHLPYNKQKFYEKIIIKKIINNKKFNNLVVISDLIKNSYINHTNKEILVLQDGAEVTKFKKNKNTNLKNDNYNIGYFGSIYKGRGIELIIKLAEINKNVIFHIIGGAKKDISIYKVKYIDNKNLKFYGHLTYSQAQLMMKSFDLLIAPYQEKVLIKNGTDTSKWMSPLKIFEYMASGIPFVCSDLVVFKKYLKNKVNCLLVKPNSINEWSESINLLKSNSKLAKFISTNAQDDIIKKYSWENRTSSILKKINK